VLAVLLYLRSDSFDVVASASMRALTLIHADVATLRCHLKAT
jgi:hypothetical protein